MAPSSDITLTKDIVNKLMVGRIIKLVESEDHEIIIGTFDDLTEPPHDCQHGMDDSNENQSWQQMNRGKMSKKQRRK